MQPITLRAGDAGLVLTPAVGGAIARYWRETAATPLEWLRPAATDAVSRRDAYGMAAFPLVPYSNRIREGRFTFRGRTVDLPLNCPPMPHYTPPGQAFFCAEPVSHVTDAVNLAAAGRPDTGLRTLEPGETLTATTPETV